MIGIKKQSYAKVLFLATFCKILWCLKLISSRRRKAWHTLRNDENYIKLKGYRFITIKFYEDKENYVFDIWAAKPNSYEIIKADINVSKEKLKVINFTTGLVES